MPLTIMSRHRLLKLCSSFILLWSLCNFYQRATHYAQQHQQAQRSLPRRLLSSEGSPQQSSSSSSSSQPLKILYIMTSMAEHDNGRRNTVKGYDRFLHTLVPVLQESVRSMVDAGCTVDVYLIAHYTVSSQRRQQLRDALPFSGLQVWDDATPLGYAVEHSVDTIQPITRALARQHRIVLKDKMHEAYDMFVNFEDDMLVRAAHVQHFWNVTNELYRLRQAVHKNKPLPRTLDEAGRAFYGPMTEIQLSRMLPGFIRVEAAVVGFHGKGPDIFQHIPRDFVWNSTTTTVGTGVDAAICCHVPLDIQMASGDHLPDSPPDVESLYYWETSIDVLGVRQMPASSSSSLGWVLLQAGNREDIFTEAEYVIGDYWSGRDGYFGNEKRPVRSKGRNMNNQGGWMATRRQIFEWHTDRCIGGFLPPYPVGRKVDGLGQESVEYWSGGLQIAGMMSCNLQRIITLEPDGFSRQLLYHTSNNKQRQQNVRHRFSSRSINQFWGQLNTIRKNAEKVMQQEMEMENNTQDQ